MTAPDLEIRGSNTCYAIFLAGRQVGRQRYWSQADVNASLPALQRRLNPGRRRRACLCCQASFTSDGPHNRLCNRCRGMV